MKTLEAVSLVLWAQAGVAGFCVAAAPAHSATPACCRLRANTVIPVELVDAVGAKTQNPGDSFAFRVAAPVIVDGRLVIRPGALGVGDVVQASKRGLGGKAAKMILAARSLTVGKKTIALRGMQLGGAGRGYANTANALGIGGIAFAPLGIVGFAVRGGNVEFAAGTAASAKVAADVILPPLGRPTRAERAQAAAAVRSEAIADGAIALPAPPRGRGQVVFFRPKTVLGTGQWFNVREDGRALGKLTNGAWFVQTVVPGPHTYTASTEPEFKDQLSLQVDAGETYFVEGELTKGVVIGVANLAPSGRAEFNKASKTLVAAGPPEPEKAAAP